MGRRFNWPWTPFSFPPDNERRKTRKSRVEDMSPAARETMRRNSATAWAKKKDDINQKRRESYSWQQEQGLPTRHAQQMDRAAKDERNRREREKRAREREERERRERTQREQREERDREARERREERERIARRAQEIRERQARERRDKGGGSRWW